jgi:hypothetical protein
VSAIDRIRDQIRSRDYFLSSHAEEEMAEDRLDRVDVENAILNGFVERNLTQDPRGTRYRVEGPAEDGRLVQVLCRFKEAGPLVIITVFEIGERNEM